MNEQEIITHIATNPTIDLADIFAELDFDNCDYPNLEASVIAFKIATKSEYRKAYAAAKRRSKIQSQLGTIPNTTRELIDAILTTTNFIMDESATQPLTWVSPIQQRRTRLDYDELIEFAMSLNRNLLGDQFKKPNVVDEIVFTQKNFAETIRSLILEKLTQTGQPFDWNELVQNSFDTTNIPADITIAVLKKFIWQVKRRLAGLPIIYHTMPVLYGNQGCGKSVFITKVLTELGPLHTTTDFNRLSDNREAALFRNFVLFLDEMNKADRADMDAVKAVITREELSYRPMGTNATVLTEQNASFIGASNKLLEQLINDPTGIRRFFQLDFNSASGAKEFAYINTLDFTAMWCSVDHLAADPCEPFRERMRQLQARHSNKSSVGEFADTLLEKLGRYAAPSPSGTEDRTLPVGILTKEQIYLAYRDWCAAMKRKAALEQQGFLAELRRMSTQDPNFPIKAKRSSKVNGWEYTGPIAAATLVINKLKGSFV